MQREILKEAFINILARGLFYDKFGLVNEKHLYDNDKLAQQTFSDKTADHFANRCCR